MLMKTISNPLAPILFAAFSGCNPSMPGAIAGDKECGSPKISAQQNLWRLEHNIRQQVVPAIPAGTEVKPAANAVPHFIRSGLRRISQAPRFKRRSQNALVKPVHHQLIFELFVILISGTCVQLTQN